MCMACRFQTLEPNTAVKIMVGCRCTDEDRMRRFVCHVLTLPLERERQLNVRHLLPSPPTSKRLLASGSASMAVDTGCRATADIRVRSPTVDTPLYPVTHALDTVHSAARILASPLCSRVAVTGLRAQAICLGRKRNRLPKWRCGRTSSLNPSCGKLRPETCR